MRLRGSGGDAPTFFTGDSSKDMHTRAWANRRGIAGVAALLLLLGLALLAANSLSTETLDLRLGHRRVGRHACTALRP
jgi:hypothetical protein